MVIAKLLRIRNALHAAAIGGFSGTLASTLVVWLPITSFLLQAVLFGILMVVVFVLSAAAVNIGLGLLSSYRS